MATARDQIEHLEHWFKNTEKPWKKYSHSRKWLKKQLSRFERRKNKIIKEDDVGGKQRRSFIGWEY